MNYDIHYANDEEAKEMNNLLTKLIQDERKYDESIDENFKVTSFYEHYVNDPKRCLLVATDKNKVIGYIYGFIKEQEAGLKEEKKASLDALYVESEYRQNKIAERLIDGFKTWCKEKDVSNLEVNVCAGNDVAHKLYLKSGFKETKFTLNMNI